MSLIKCGMQRSPCSIVSLSTPRAPPCLRPRMHQARRHRLQLLARAEQADGEASTSSSSAPPALTIKETKGPVQPLQLLPKETIFYEGAGAAAELALSLALAATLIYIPLTMASIGRRLWIKYTFTNKRVVVTNSSPLFSRTVQVPYTQIKETRTVPRAFGAWGDMVIFLKDGARLEITGLENFADVKRHIESCIYD